MNSAGAAAQNRFAAEDVWNYFRTLKTVGVVNDTGFYEIVMDFQGRNHVVLFPIAETAIIFNEALPTIGADFEVER